MKEDSNKDLYIHRLLEESERDRLLDDLDRNSTPGGPGSRRASERHTFRQSNLPVTIVHPAGGETWFLAQARNLSATGLAVIHTGYIHAGSRCRVVLHSRANESVSVKGRVVRCRHLAGIIHELGIHYDMPIDIESFTGSNDPHRVKTLSDIITVRNMSVLCIAPSKSEARMITCQLESARVLIDRMLDFVSALVRLRRQTLRYDLVIVPPRMGHSDAAFIASAIRKAGFTRPILAYKSSPSAPTPDDNLEPIEWLTLETTQEHFLTTIITLLDAESGGTVVASSTQLGAL